MKNRDELGVFLNSLGLTGLGAEIGVLRGENVESILKDWKGYGMFLIDPYDLTKCGEYIDGTRENDFSQALDICKKLLATYPLRTILINETSDTAYELLKGVQLDFVYIDGNHHEPQITKDLTNYWSLIKSGGILCGHDYKNEHIPDVYKCEVKDAVDKFLSEHTYQDFFTTPECSSWYILK